MPRGDRTGPEGMGPRTGRAAGYCTGYDMPGYMNNEFPRGYRYRTYRRGAFGGRGFRRWHMRPMHGGWYDYGAFPGAAYPGAYRPPAPITEDEVQEALKAEETWLEEQLEAVRSQMKKEE